MSRSSHRVAEKGRRYTDGLIECSRKYPYQKSICLYTSTSMLDMYPGNMPKLCYESTKKWWKKKSCSCDDELRFLSSHLPEYTPEISLPKLRTREVRNNLHTLDRYDAMMWLFSSSWLSDRWSQSDDISIFSFDPCICPLACVTLESSFVRREVWSEVKDSYFLHATIVDS